MPQRQKNSKKTSNRKPVAPKGSPAKMKNAAGRKPVHDRASVGSKLVIITGLSGSGKMSALKVFEDLGYYCVDNLPIELIPNFAELIRESREPLNGAMVIDIREGAKLDQLPRTIHDLKKVLDTKLLFLDTSTSVILRRFSETRRPHPIAGVSVERSIEDERKRLEPILNVADFSIDTSKFNVHELRQHITEVFGNDAPKPKTISISTVSFGFRNGVPEGADLVFDVRFLPNPHFVPEFRPLTGKDPKVAKYILSFPQTKEFIKRISDLLVYLLPHYIEEGKSYLTIAFGCTGGQHRSVFIAEQVKKLLAKAGYRVKVQHRDSPR
jgi:RNase adapter protein RapZ